MSIVRPIAEYASPEWSPNTNREVNKNEQVQKRAARFVKNDYNPYTSTSGLVSSRLGLPSTVAHKGHHCIRMLYLTFSVVTLMGHRTLEHRRLLAQVSLFYTMIRNCLVNISFPSSIQENHRATRFNLNKYKQLNSNILTHIHSSPEPSEPGSARVLFIQKSKN